MGAFPSQGCLTTPDREIGSTGFLRAYAALFDRWVCLTPSRALKASSSSRRRWRRASRDAEFVAPPRDQLMLDRRGRAMQACARAPPLLINAQIAGPLSGVTGKHLLTSRLTGFAPKQT